MTREEIRNHLTDILCENNTIAPSRIVFEEEQEALRMAIKFLETEPLTDTEQRIFLAAMSREEKVCKEVDADYPDDDFGVNLVAVCQMIERKVKKTLWN